MRQKLQKKKEIKEAFLFLLKFNLFLIPFYAIIFLDVDFYSVQIFIAKSIVYVLKLFGLKAFNVDFFVYLGQEGFPIDISRDCTGWKSLYSLLAIVLASPGTLKKKKDFLIRWLPVMFMINAIRVFSTIIVGFLFGFQLMDPVHSVWQYLTIVSIIAIWYLYIRKNYFKLERKKK